jgi:hypothetical protein
MTDEQIKAAQKDPVKANQGLLQKIGNGLNFILENIVGLDTPVYSELWQCAKCGERLSAICKIAGVVGKDVIKNAILIWVGGKAIQGVAKLGKGLLKTTTKIFNSSVKGSTKLLSKSALGRATLKWGAEKTASLSAKSADRFRAFMGTKVGKFSKAVLKGISITGKAAGTVFETIDKVMLLPVKVTVRAGRAVVGEVKAMANQSKIFARTPILTAEEASRTGLKAIKDLPPNTELHLEVPSPVTPAMEDSKKFLSSKLKGKDLKGFTNDIENATEMTAEVAGQKAIKVDTPHGSKYVAVDQPANVAKVHVFGDDSGKVILQMNDGKILLGNNGKIVKTIANPKEISKLEPLLGKELQNADQLALKEMKSTAEMNGITAKETVASTEAKAADEFKVEAPKECGGGPITFGAIAR